ncbi:hypothetical protein AVEN_42015-1, partial [Araneus ventricosus]
QSSKSSQIVDSSTRNNLLNTSNSRLEHFLIPNSSASANRNTFYPENELHRITKSGEFDSSSLDTLPVNDVNSFNENINTFQKYPVAYYSNKTKVDNNVTNQTFSRLPIAQRESLLVRNQYQNNGHLQWYQYLPSIPSSGHTRQNHVDYPADSTNESHGTGMSVINDTFFLSQESSEQKETNLTISDFKEKGNGTQDQEFKAPVSEEQKPPVDHEIVSLNASTPESSIQSTGENQKVKADKQKELQKVTVKHFKLQQKSSEQNSQEKGLAKSTDLPSNARKTVITTKKMKSLQSMQNKLSNFQEKKAETRWLLKNNVSFPVSKSLVSSPMSTIFDTSNENGQYYHYVMNIGSKNRNKMHSVRNLFKILSESGNGKNTREMKILREKLKNIYFNNVRKGNKQPIESSRKETNIYTNNTNSSVNALETLENASAISEIPKNVSNVTFQDSTFEKDTKQQITDKFIDNSTSIVSIEKQTGPSTSTTKDVLTEATTMQPTMQQSSTSSFLADLFEIDSTTKDILTTIAILDKAETTTKINGIDSRGKPPLLLPTIVPDVDSDSVLIVKKSYKNNSDNLQVERNGISSFIAQSTTVSGVDRNCRNTTELKNSLQFKQKTTTSYETSAVTTDSTTVPEMSPFISTSTELGVDRNCRNTTELKNSPQFKQETTTSYETSAVTTDSTTVTEMSPFISTSTELSNSTSILSVGLDNFLTEITTTPSSSASEIDQDNKLKEPFYFSTTANSYSESLGVTTDSSIATEAHIQTSPGPTDPSLSSSTLTPNENSNNSSAIPPSTNATEIPLNVLESDLPASFSTFEENPRNISGQYEDDNSRTTNIVEINSNASTKMNEDTNTNEIKYEMKSTSIKSGQSTAMIANATLHIESADSMLDFNNKTLPPRETEYRLLLANTSDVELSANGNNHLNNSILNETLESGTQLNTESSLGTHFPLASSMTNIKDSDNPALYSKGQNETLIKPNLPLVPTETNTSVNEMLISDTNGGNISDLTSRITQSSISPEMKSLNLPHEVVSNSSDGSISINPMQYASDFSNLSDSQYPDQLQLTTENSISNLSFSSSLNDELIHKSYVPANYLNNYYFKETNHNEESSFLLPSIVDEEAGFPLSIHNEDLHFVPSVVENYQIHSPEESQSQVNFKYINYHYEPDTPYVQEEKFKSPSQPQVVNIPFDIESDDITAYKVYEQMPDVEYVELVPYADINFDNSDPEVDESKFLSDSVLSLDDYSIPTLNENVQHNELNHDNENGYFDRNSLSKNLFVSASNVEEPTYITPNTSPKFGTRLQKKIL